MLRLLQYIVILTIVNFVVSASLDPPPQPMKTITPFTAQLVTFTTTLPVGEVIARLDVEVNKTGSAGFTSQMKAVTNKTDIENVINPIVGDRDFLYFLEFNHNPWLNAFNGVNNTPVTVVYTIGNPLVAQTIMQYDLRSGYNIPPRLLVLENADHNGTSVIYHLPSSVMALTDNPDLKAAAVALDEKLDKMVTKITTV
ncbi:hypothetical protein BD779DRAFT_1781942 [Infundibulicybe gibba]|nr:hypothetical protein BD779DRAFT_1781942 [Infundibulicybe gibba]